MRALLDRLYKLSGALAAVFLAARSGNWITGQTIVADGGFMAT